MRLHGIIPPLLTPFDQAGRVDQPALERLTKHLLDGGVHGLFIFGSTGEFATLGTEQRAHVLEVVTGVADGRVPVLAGIADTGTWRAIANAEQALAGGADALVLTAPFYHIVSQAETIAHFRTVHDAVGAPLVAYDIPQLVKTKLALETVLQLAQDGIIIGLKDSSGDQNNLRDLLVRAKANPATSGLRMFTGSEQIVDAAVAMGAHGAVPGLGNVEPRGYVALFEAASAGDFDKARRIQDLLVELFGIILFGSPASSGSGAALSGFKAALVHLGVLPSSRMAPPLTSLSPEGDAKVARLTEDVLGRLAPLLG